MKDAKGHGSEAHGAHAQGVDKVGRPKYVYHATIEPNLKSIAQKGLTPSPETQNWAFSNNPTDKVFLSPTPSGANYYGALASKNYGSLWGQPEPPSVLLRSPVTGNEQPFSHGAKQELVGDPIHPSKLEFNTGDGQWRPMTAGALHEAGVKEYPDPEKFYPTGQPRSGPLPPRWPGDTGLGYDEMKKRAGL